MLRFLTFWHLLSLKLGVLNADFDIKITDATRLEPHEVISFPLQLMHGGALIFFFSISLSSSMFH